MSGAASDPLAVTANSSAMYLDLLAREAAAAGLPKPALEELARPLRHHLDDARRVLEVGQPPVVIAGLKIAAVRAGDALGLEIRNEAAMDLAYLVVSEPSPNIDNCRGARPLPLNVLLIGARQRDTRVECVWREETAIVVTRVETLELPPLSARLVAQVPPAEVGIEERVARGHRAEITGEKCPSIVPQAVRTGLETGEIGWRDLIDFYARHPCRYYQFPVTYRAFTGDGALRVPVPDSAR